MEKVEFNEDVKKLLEETRNKLKGITFEDIYINELIYGIEEAEILEEDDSISINKLKQTLTIEDIKEFASEMLYDDKINSIINEAITSFIAKMGEE